MNKIIAYTIPRIICSDGFSFSLQGGYGMYSSHKDLEIRFYGWVPVAKIAALVTKHGGLDKNYIQSEGLMLFNCLSPYLAVRRQLERELRE